MITTDTTPTPPQSPAASSITRADTGLGTTFERWALNRCLLRLHAQATFEEVMEGPGDGMTGIAGLNSLALGLQGARVALLLPDAERAVFARTVWARHAPQAALEICTSWDGRCLPFPDGAFDLAWNFNIMTRPDEPQALLAELARVSRRYVLIFVPSRLNYAFGLHRLHHRVAGEPWDHGRVDLMHPRPWLRRFAAAGLRVLETIWLDCPWWPDIVDPRQFLADFFPFLKRPAFRSFLQGASSENRYRWEAVDLPYYHPQQHPAVHSHMERLGTIENSRFPWLKQRFAHHTGIFSVKEG